MPNTNGSIAVIDNTMLSRSMRPGRGSRDSGSSRTAATRKIRMIGTLMKNTEPHQKCSSSQPPTTGPSAAPPANIAAQVAIASRRSSPCVKMLRINDSVDGIRVAPNTPSNAREANRASALGLNAAHTDAMPNPTAPISSSRRRPMRSPRLPIATSSPASIRG